MYFTIFLHDHAWDNATNIYQHPKSVQSHKLLNSLQSHPNKSLVNIENNNYFAISGTARLSTVIDKQPPMPLLDCIVFQLSITVSYLTFKTHKLKFLALSKGRVTCLAQF